MMKTSRTICRLILPLLFAVLLAAGILVFVFSRNPAHDDIMSGLYEHPVYDVVGKARAVYCALLPIGWLYDQVAHG